MLYFIGKKHNSKQKVGFEKIDLDHYLEELRTDLNVDENFSIVLEDGTNQQVGLRLGTIRGFLLKEGHETVSVPRVISRGSGRTTQAEEQRRMILLGFPSIPPRDIDDRILPTSFFVDNLGGKLLINRVRESLPSNNRLLLDGINSDSLGENEPLATENAGRSLVLDGFDSTGDGTEITDVGDAVLLHSFDEIVSPIALETTFRISNEGQIPFENRTLNSLTSPIGGQSIVRPAEIRTRTTGDIALEDGLGHLVLNGTDSSSTNAGDNMDLEGATGITI